jgi:ATP-dependent exoDNAse (exonuclease V) beta subunit
MHPLGSETVAGEGLAATDVGSAVHELLEQLDLSAPSAPGRDELERSVLEHFPSASASDLERIERFVRAYCDSDLARRVAELPALATELPFVFEQAGVLVNGFLDVASFADGRAFVLDYKTNWLGERSPEEITDSEYRLQLLVYALACLKAGYEQVEVAYVFLERPDAVVSRSFGPDDRPALERELDEAIARIELGEFPARPGARICSDCPARGLVCAGMDLPDAPPRMALVPGS